MKMLGRFCILNKPLLALLCVGVFVLSGCSFDAVISSLTDLNSISISGKIANYSNNSSQASVQAVSPLICSSPIVSVYKLDANGNRILPAIASTQVNADGSYLFSAEALGHYSETNEFISAAMIVEVLGCSSTYFRPVTGVSEQNITMASSLFGYLLNTDQKMKLATALQGDGKQLSSLMALLGTPNSIDDAYNILLANSEASAAFTEIFGVGPETLLDASPEVLIANLPKSAQEKIAVSLQANAVHWSNSYPIAYQWKIDNTVISANKDFDYSAGGNMQGVHTLTLTIGKNDGTGKVDLAKPFKVISSTLDIANNVLPTSPSFLITSPVNASGVPVNTRSLVLTLNTGIDLANCDSFSGLLLSDDATEPVSSQSFPITCIQNGVQNVNYTLSSANDGVKTIYLWAKDASGTISVAPATVQVTLDTTKPTASIITQPLAQSKATAQSFAFTGDDGIGAIDHFECKIDSGAWTSCSSPTSYAGLIEGDHAFSLRAVDTAGNISEIESKIWHIDLTAPVLTLVGPTAINNSLSAVFNLSATDSGGSGVASFACSMDGAAYTACSAVSNYVLSAGSHVFKAKAYDGAGNVSSLQTHSWTIDTTPPTVTITSKPAALTNAMTATFAFAGSDTGGGNVASYECQLDGSGFAACATGKSYLSLVDGSHVFQVRAVDTAGNTGAAVSYSWTVNTSTPMASISSSPESITNQTSATLVFSATAPSGGSITGYQCNINNEGWVTCASPKTYTNLLQGTQNFQVRSIDNNSNLSDPTSYSWVIDTTVPTLAISSKPDTWSNSTTAQFVFAGSDTGGGSVASYYCQIDGAGYSECSSPRNLSLLTQGSHTFDVKVMDTAGNSSAVLSTTWGVDLNAPTMSLVATPGGLTNSTSASFSFSSADLGGSGVLGFMCSLDAAVPVSCSSGVSYASLAAGAHSFEASVYDAAGNYSTPVSYSWTVDLTPPTVSLTAKPALNSNSTSASFGFTGSDTGGGSVAGYKCKIDGGSYASCSSGVTYSSLADGIHSFSVYATDTAGNAGVATTYTWTLDTVAPTVTITTPSVNGTVIPAVSLSAVAIGGACSENGATVSLSGISTLTTTCASGSWSVSLNMSSVSDATYTLSASQTDAAGNIGTATRTVIKDNTAPVISLTTPGAAQGGNTMNINWVNTESNVASGSSFLVELYDGAAWTSLGTKSATAGLNSAVSYSLLGASVPAVTTNSAKVRVSLTDAAGNTSTVTSNSFAIDSAPPSVVGLSVNGGASTTNSNFVSVNLQLADNFAANYFCVKYNSTTTPAATDSCWTSVASSLGGNQIPAPSINVTGYSFQLGYGASTYKIYAWAKDQAGNISSLSNSGNGTAGVDTTSIIYTPGTAPTISSFVGIGSNLPSAQPPALSDTTIAAGSSVYIRWAVSGNLGQNPISLYYKLTSASSWTQIATNLVNGVNGSCTADDPGTAQVEGGCYVWSGGSPSASAYQIQIRVADTNSMVSMATAAMINSGQIQILAGNTEPGVGGSAKSAIYFSTGGGDQTWVNQFVVAPNGYIYIYDTRGIFRIQPANGISTLLIAKTGTMNVTAAGVLASSATLDNINGITLDYNQNILVRTTSAILSFPSNVDNPTVKKIIGGGSVTTDKTAPLNFNLSLGFDKDGAFTMLTPLPNGDIYFSQANLRSYYSASDGLIHNLPAHSGIGASGKNTLDISSCLLENFGLSFDPATSAITYVMANVVASDCGAGTTGPVVILDPTTMVSVGNYPTGPIGLTYGYTNGLKTGMDGSLYAMNMSAGRVAKFDPATNKFTYFIGNGTAGYCADGTPIANCSLSPQSLFVSQSGTIYFLDNGQIRTVLPDNTVYTLYGAFGAAGDGAAAPMARLTGSYSIQQSNDGKIQILQGLYHVVREIGIDGVINRIAGNWNSGAINTTLVATQTPIHGLGSWTSPSSIYTDPVSGNIYYYDSNNGLFYLNRSTSLWNRVTGGGATDWVNAEGLPGTSIGFSKSGYNNIFGSASKIYLYESLNNGSSLAVNFLQSYDRTNSYKQSLVLGSTFNDGSLSNCAVGSVATGCVFPATINGGNPFFDDAGARLFVPYNGTASIWVYQNGSFVSSISTVQSVKNAVFRVNSANQEIIYYCNGTAIYQKNLTAGTDAVLPKWPSGLTCSLNARNIVYDSANKRLIFIFSQNGLLGVAAYNLTD